MILDLTSSFIHGMYVKEYQSRNVTRHADERSRERKVTHKLSTYLLFAGASMSSAGPLWTLAITFRAFFCNIKDDTWPLSSQFTIRISFSFFLIPPFLCSLHSIPDRRRLKRSLANRRRRWRAYNSTGLKHKKSLILYFVLHLKKNLPLYHLELQQKPRIQHECVLLLNNEME